MVVVLVVVVLVLCAGIPARASTEPPPALVLEGDAAAYALGGHLSVLEDRAGSMTIDAVSQRHDFHVPGARKLDPGTLWYRFTAVRAKERPAEWILAFGEPDIDDVRVFVPVKGGGFSEIVLGRRIPSRDLPIAARRHVAALDLPDGGPVTIHLRLASDRKIRFENAILSLPTALIFEEARQSTILGIRFGILAAIMMMSVVCGVWLRDTVMVAYSAFVGTVLSRDISHTSIITLLFPASGSDTNNFMTGFGLLAGVAVFIFMWDRILELRKNFPVMHRVYMLTFTVMALSLFWVLNQNFHFFARTALVLMFAASFCSSVMAGILFARNPRNVQLAFYVLAFFPLVMAAGAEVGALLFLWVPTEMGRDLQRAATLIHITILSVALAHRLGQMQRDRVRADTELTATRIAMREHRNFVSMLSHQLGNPMAIITAAAGLLDLKQPGLMETVTIRRAVRRMRDLTADVLADARLNKVAAELLVRTVDLAELLRTLVDERRNHSPHSFRLDCGGGACVDGDPTLLAVLFANLLDNAIKFSPSGKEIRIGLACGDGTAAVTIADDGPGIAPEEAEKVFEKFYRSAATSSQPGTGLGLYLVRRIAERHGGSALLATTPGHGAEFTVRLPATHATAAVNA